MVAWERVWRLQIRAMLKCPWAAERVAARAAALAGPAVALGGVVRIGGCLLPSLFLLSWPGRWSAWRPAGCWCPGLSGSGSGWA